MSVWLLEKGTCFDLEGGLAGHTYLDSRGLLGLVSGSVDLRFELCGWIDGLLVLCNLLLLLLKVRPKCWQTLHIRRP